MGLFNSIAGQVAGTLSGQAASSGGGLDLSAIVGTLLNNPQTGGLQGLLSSFETKGLGGIVSSWVGTGANLPISAAQIQSVLGQGPLQALAEKAGLSTEQIATQLSEHLPGLIDKLTPNGEVPQGDLMAQGMGLLKGFMK